MGRRQGHDPGRRAERQDRRHAGQGRAARLRPLAGTAVPHVGHARERHVADMAGRARVHRHLRGLRRRALPVLAGRRLRRPRGGHRQRGDVRRAGPVLGDRPPAADQVRARPLPAGRGAGRLPGHRRVPAPVPRADHEAAAERRPQPGVRRRPGQRHARRPRGRAQSVHPPRLQGRRRDDAARPGPHGRPRPDDLRVVRPRLRAAVPGDRRQQGARRPRPAVAAADLQLPRGDRRDDRQGEGVLRRRHRPGLPQPRRARPGRRRASSRWRPRTRRPRWPGSRPRSSPSRTPTTGPATGSPRAGT